jgi:hypothetical protein
MMAWRYLGVAGASHATQSHRVGRMQWMLRREPHRGPPP